LEFLQGAREGSMVGKVKLYFNLPRNLHVSPYFNFSGMFLKILLLFFRFSNRKGEEFGILYCLQGK